MAPAGRFGAQFFITWGVNVTWMGLGPPPAAGQPQRLLQMRELARDCAVTKRERDDSLTELPLLTQPIFRYEAAQAAAALHQLSRKATCKSPSSRFFAPGWAARATSTVKNFHGNCLPVIGLCHGWHSSAVARHGDCSSRGPS
jgi:hypothetical protein